jgi:hypothetical protein
MCEREVSWWIMTSAQTRAPFFTRWDSMLLPLDPPSPCAAFRRALDNLRFALAAPFFFVWIAWPEAHDAINDLIDEIGVGR